MMFPVILVWLMSIGESQGMPKYIDKYINPCGAIYSSVIPDLDGIRMVFHHIKPSILMVEHGLMASHHKAMEEYIYRKNWIPDDSNISITDNKLHRFNQLPVIYKSLQVFSYALDVIQEDSRKAQESDDCFFFLDTLPKAIAHHQQLMCAVDSAMGQLKMEVPVIRMIDLPRDWLDPEDKSCVNRFFRLAEVHTKYRRFLKALHNLAEV